MAVHVSAYTSQVWTYTNWRWFHPVQFLEEALQADGIPFVEVGDIDIEGGRLMDGSLPRYPILFSLAAEAISDAEALRMRTFVKAGGYAYVGSSSWTRREDGSIRRDGVSGKAVFALGDEMGLVPGGWIRIGTVDKIGNAPMIDHLLAGTMDWQMPRRYSDLDLWTSHWVWKAMPGFNPDVLLQSASAGKGGFLKSFGNPPGVSDPANTAIRFGDVNGDGRADLVYRQGEKVYVRIASLSNEGEPGVDHSLNGLALQPAAEWSDWAAAYSFDVADVDGDGKADLVGRGSDVGDIQVGLSDGRSFTRSMSWRDWSLDYDMQFADVDGDGAADIVGRSSDGDVQVGLSTGGSFARSDSWATWSPNYSMAFADVDGDGDADIVGRPYDGVDVQVGLSNGKGGGRGFNPSTSWTSWASGYTVAFGDVDGDGLADIIGRSASNDDVQVGLSQGAQQTFATSRSWTAWNGGFTLDLADINGDGAADLVGCNQTSPEYPPGDVEIALSGGPIGVAAAALAQKTYGAGKFIYNAEIVPTAGYGGFANDNSEYKTIRDSIVEAFTASASMPLVTLAPWPFPATAALIYRHDDFLSIDVHGVEQQMVGASPSHPFGEYYLMPETAGETGPCQEINDYPTGGGSILQAGGLIGSHVELHDLLDAFGYTDALAKIQNTAAHIQAGIGGGMSPIFTAPDYRAVKRTSMQAIGDAGLLTAGEQGVGPLPHFAFDPETKGAYLGALLELPTSEWPAYDDLERMTAAPDSINRAAALAHELGGLINVYDHAGADSYDGGCTTRAQLARLYLSYAAGLPGIWKTSSLEIRRWWLQRDAHEFSASFRNLGGVPAAIEVTLQPRSPRAPTDYPADDLALRLFLDADSASKVSAGIAVVLDGVLQPGTTCFDNPRVLCTRDPAGNSVLHVKIGAARQVLIQIGQLVIP